MSPTHNRGKFITRNQMTGQKGINLIEKIILEMGYVWAPTSGATDAGIDGNIYIRQPDTGEATAFVLQVQSKAVDIEFESETPTSFVYRVKENDLNYWLAGNAPVLLIVSRPATDEAYWVSIKHYFNTAEQRASRKVQFSKVNDRFTKVSAGAIASLAIPSDQGIYLRPPPKEEILTTNLLEVARYADTLFVAQTLHTKPAEVAEVFDELEERPGHVWFLKEGKIYSFHDLREYPWTKVVEAGTTEQFDTSEWASSTDVERRNDFVRLLHQALRTFASRRDIGVFTQPKRSHVYYFRPVMRRVAETDTNEFIERDVSWQSQKENTRRVVERYYSKKDSTKLSFYRHHGFTGKFKRFGHRWYFEITPTYHYTIDGKNESPFRESNLAGMKRQEGHASVANNVRFLGYYLSYHDLYYREYPFLRFGRLLDFNVPFGIPDTDWANRVDPDEVAPPEPDTDVQSQSELALK